MSNAIQVGPLLLPFTLLLVFASAGSTLALGKRLSREASADVEQTLWHALLVGALLARLAFVYQYGTQYLDSPLTILDIRDGGWNATFGLVGVWTYALYKGRRAHFIRKPLFWALGVGTAVFVAVTISARRQRSGSGTAIKARIFNSEGALVSVRTGELSKATLSERLEDSVQRP